MLATLPRMELEPPPGYVVFVARHLDVLRHDAARVVGGDDARAGGLYCDALSDVAGRWGLLELIGTWLRRPDAADSYLRRAFARRVQRWEIDQTWVESGEMVDFEVWLTDAQPRPFRTNVALRLWQVTAKPLPPAGPVAEAAVAWWHAYEARRYRRWAVAAALVFAMIVLVFGYLQHVSVAG